MVLELDLGVISVGLRRFRALGPWGTADTSPASSMLGTMIATVPVSPVGTDDAFFSFRRPDGLTGIACSLPTDKSVGYSHASLRDQRLLRLIRGAPARLDSECHLP